MCSRCSRDLLSLEHLEHLEHLDHLCFYGTDASHSCASGLFSSSNGIGKLTSSP